MKKNRGPVATQAGFTLIEIMLGTSIMVIVLVALLGSFFGQSTLNQNARNMMAAVNDATRIMEEIRRQNARNPDGSFPAGSLCATSNIPSARPPSQQSWNEWLDAQVPAKSLAGSGNIHEIAVVTCQDQDGGTALSDYCGWTATGQGAQVGPAEWYPWYGGGLAMTNGHLPFQWGPTAFDPIRVTVAVGWAQKRAGGGTLPLGGSGSEFTYNVTGIGKGAIVQEQLRVGPDAPEPGFPDGDGVIESPAMLTTMVTCR